MANEMKQIANRVRGIAVENGYTQQRVADTLGLARSSVAERYAGRVPFTAPEVLVLAEVMNVEPGEFFPKARPARASTAAVAA